MTLYALSFSCSCKSNSKLYISLVTFFLIFCFFIFLVYVTKFTNSWYGLLTMSVSAPVLIFCFSPKTKTKVFETMVTMMNLSV